MGFKIIVFVGTYCQILNFDKLSVTLVIWLDNHCYENYIITTKVGWND